MATEVLVRRAVPDDAPGLARVKVDTWRSAYRGIVPDGYLAGLSYEENTGRFRDAISRGGDEYFYVAEAGGIVAGFSICGPEREGSGLYGGEVYAIYVLPAYQRRGIGHMLIKAATATLQELGFTSMLLWTPDNNPYCRFYERLGGVRVARKGYEVGGATLDLVAYGWKEFPR